jgi:hypothetical protein
MSSKAKASAIIAGAGWVAGVFISLANRVHEMGGSDEDIHRLATPEGEKILDQIAEIIARDARPRFKITVDYNQTLEQMIESCNFEGGVNSDISSKNFPVLGSGKRDLEIELFRFMGFVSGDKSLQEIKKAGYRPATLPEILALAKDHPELQTKFSVVALGSAWRNPYLFVPIIDRRLNVVWFGGAFPESCRFAAVRE